MGSLADVNSDGEICYDEFVAMMFPAAASALAKFRKHHRTLKNAKHAFDSYDVDGDGEITYEELVGGMGGDYSASVTCRESGRPSRSLTLTETPRFPGRR